VSNLERSSAAARDGFVTYDELDVSKRERGVDT
jgi:hypothetical protein